MDKTKTLLQPKTLPDGAGESSRLEGGIDIFALTGFMSLKQAASRGGKEEQDSGKGGGQNMNVKKPILCPFL